MIEVQEHVSLRRQCELLAISRSGLYYEPVGTSAEELALMITNPSRRPAYATLLLV